MLTHRERRDDLSMYLTLSRQQRASCATCSLLERTHLQKAKTNTAFSLSGVLFLNLLKLSWCQLVTKLLQMSSKIPFVSLFYIEHSRSDTRWHRWISKGSCEALL